MEGKVVRISKTRIRAVGAYLRSFSPDTSIRIARRVASSDEIRKVGFSDSASTGSTILPSPIGPVSEFNAEGKWIKRTDLPKERRYVMTRQWTWTEFRGRYETVEKSDFRDIYRDCYVREFVDPPAVEVSLLGDTKQPILATAPFSKSTSANELILHSVNLFLEFFGSCEIVKANFEGMDQQKVTRVNWRMLPPGKYPWDDIKSHVERVIKPDSGIVDPVIMDRQRTIEKYKPDAIYIGEGGFSRYVAYEFRSAKKVILECIDYGNALYVLGEDWKAVSRLTKAEVLSNDLHDNRIIHSSGWKQRLAHVMNSKKA